MAPSPSRGAHRTVRVTATARLHLGFYGLAPFGKHKYGGIGLAIERPRYVVTVKRGEGKVYGCQRSRVEHILKRVLTALGSSGTYDVEVLECIPEHRGFGSTTQLTLSIACAMQVMERGAASSIDSLAEILGRASISGIGLAAFKYGGFIVDSGISEQHSVAKTLVRLPFPEHWYIVVVTPRTKVRVEESLGERAAVEEVLGGPVHDRDMARAMNLVFRCVLPSLISEDFQSFTECVEELQQLVGRLFSAFQGGVFSSWEGEVIYHLLKKLGGRGVGQSSWGPSLYAFFPNKTSARYALERVSKMAEREGVELEYLFLTRANNRGAAIEATF